VQLIVEKEIFIVVASLVVRCCAVKKNVIVASRCCRCKFTIEKEVSLELLQFIQKYNLGSSVPNIVIALQNLLTIAFSVATCESFSKLKLIKNYSRSSVSTLRLRNLAILPLQNNNWQMK